MVCLRKEVTPGHTYLQKVLHPFWVVAITLPAYPLHLLDLPRLTGSLNVFQVHVRILAEVYNRAEEVEEAYKERLFHLTPS